MVGQISFSVGCNVKNHLVVRNRLLFLSSVGLRIALYNAATIQTFRRRTKPSTPLQPSTTNLEFHPSQNRPPPANGDARKFDRRLSRRPGLAQASRPS